MDVPDLSVIKTPDDLRPAAGNPWGIRETKRGFWWGNDEGPLLYKTDAAGALAARILDVKMGLPTGRTRAIRYDGTGTLKTREEREVMTAEAAIEKLESGRTL